MQGMRRILENEELPERSIQADRNASLFHIAIPGVGDQDRARRIGLRLDLAGGQRLGFDPPPS